MAKWVWMGLFVSGAAVSIWQIVSSTSVLVGAVVGLALSCFALGFEVGLIVIESGCSRT